MPLVMERVEQVKEFRLNSTRKQTKLLADYPREFAEIRQPDSYYILVPRHTSENREYVPMGFFDKNNIVSDTCSFVPNASLYDFGILTSKMHMTWMSYVCGRLKGDYRYSATIVYNNFPFPKEIPETLCQKIKEASEDILLIREKYVDESLSNLYDPMLMPSDLRKAHRKLDDLVDKAYSNDKFVNDDDRMKLLFDLYQELI